LKAFGFTAETFSSAEEFLQTPIEGDRRKISGARSGQKGSKRSCRQPLITLQLPNGPWHYPDLLDMADHEESVGQSVYSIRPLLRVARERQLLAGGQPVEFGGRAFDLLMVPTERPAPS
jgi:hypothetical protein